MKTRPIHLLLVMTCVLCLTPTWVMAQGRPARLQPEQAPLFSAVARVVSITPDKTPTPDDARYTFSWNARGAGSSQTTGDAWSEPFAFGIEQVKVNMAGYPFQYMPHYPLVVRLTVSPVRQRTQIEAKLTFEEGGVFELTGDLYGGQLGVLIWRDEDGKPQAATMREYNHRYWRALDGMAMGPDDRPKHFPIIDRFIGGDSDYANWKEGVNQLSRAGFSALMLPPDATMRGLLNELGLERTAWAIYSPPGYAFDFSPDITPESLQAWADGLAKPYLDAGYDARDIALYTLSDEPGWYYPSQFRTLEKSEEGMARFHAYLADQGLTPADLGCENWDAVKPLGRSQAKDLPSRRLHYWTTRFFPWDSANHFANATRAMENAFYEGMPIITNWNFFIGRDYVPGPVANNPNKQDPDAAMGGHDWLEFGRLRGGTMIWTEDWFSDRQAPQWSFYASKMASAGRHSGVPFGGYVIPRTSGDREDGVLQKILTVAGSGGKAIKYFVFGPEYNFPINCYSEKSYLLPRMARAHRMIAHAEDVLWPGGRPQAQVAILSPRSSLTWDLLDMPIAQGIYDATNTNLNRARMAYVAETYNLYTSLQHQSIPCDFVEELDLTPEGLAPYKVLYVTQPNVPVEHQAGVKAWVEAGGTLVLTTGAMTADRYNDPTSLAADWLGARETSPNPRLVQANLNVVPWVSKARLSDPADDAEGNGQFRLAGVAPSLEIEDENARVVVVDHNGAPASIQMQRGRGVVIHHAWLPGLSYAKSAESTSDGLPAGFDVQLRQFINQPVYDAGVQRPVDVSLDLIEAFRLDSDAGVAITLLNWTGQPQEAVTLTFNAPHRDMKVISVLHGQLERQQVDGEYTVTLPLAAADILRVVR